MLEAAAGGVGEASTDRLLLAAATLALLATVAEDTPVLLVLDDGKPVGVLTRQDLLGDIG